MTRVGEWRGGVPAEVLFVWSMPELDMEKEVSEELQAGVPRGLLKYAAHQTARSFIQAWSQHKAGLPIDDIGRRKIDEQLMLAPLFKDHFAVDKSKRKRN